MALLGVSGIVSLRAAMVGGRPVAQHQPLPPGFHLGFTLADADAVVAMHAEVEAVMAVGPIQDERPDEDYVSFRCWDPNGTEIEVFWDGDGA